MYIVTFTTHQQRKMVRTPTFFWAGDVNRIAVDIPRFVRFSESEIRSAARSLLPDNPAHHGPADVHPSRVDCRMLGRHRNILHGSHVLYDRKSTQFIFRLKMC